jgi:putative ABC transport system permease protein
LSDLWNSLSATAQDVIFLALLLAPVAFIAALLAWGYRPWVLLRALLWRHRWINAVFVALIAISVAVGVGIIAQERGLRQGSAEAAKKFTLIVAAPGNDVSMLLSTVYLQPYLAPLLDGEAYQQIAEHDRVAFAAPIAYGDSYQGAPIVGTTREFVEHLAGEPSEGRYFESHFDAVIGSKARLDVGARFVPAHGRIPGQTEHGVHDASYSVVGRLGPTGSPWDKAILVPIESVWELHGLSNGHAPENSNQLGPPFDAKYFPGTQAVLVESTSLVANYQLRTEFNTAGMMAFFPAEVLTRLYSILGDIRDIMQVLAVMTQVLVGVAVLCGFVILMRLFSRRLALLRALGASERFLFAVVWFYAATLMVIGVVLGCLLGLLATRVISDIVSQRTELDITAALAWPEIHLVAGFLTLSLIFALLPPALVLRRPVIPELRA